MIFDDGEICECECCGQDVCECTGPYCNTCECCKLHCECGKDEDDE